MANYETLFPQLWGGTAYNAYPNPTSGKGIYGMVPGVTSLPNVAGDVAGVYPGLQQSTEAVSNAVLSKLKGELSPATIAGIQDSAARFGVKSGMPGSGLAANRGLRDLGLNTEAVIQQGVQDYMGLLPTIAKNLTISPETQIGLSQNNAVLRSAPDPTQAGSYAENLFRNYMASMRNSGAGPAGGTGTYAGRAPTSGLFQSGGGIDPYEQTPFTPTGPPNAFEGENFMSGIINASPETSAAFQDWTGGASRGPNDYYDYWMGMPDYQAEQYVTPSYIAPQEDYPAWDNYEMLFDY